MSERQERHGSSGYLAGMVCAMGLGSLLGLLFFDNVALGFAVALPLGAAGGLYYDHRRKARRSPGDAA